MALVVMCVVLAMVAVATAAMLLATRRHVRALKERYRVVISADEEAARIVEDARARAAVATSDASRAVTSARDELRRVEEQTAAAIERRVALATDHQGAQQAYDRLVREVRALEENLDDISYGLYKPHYHFDTPEEFKRELEKVLEREKEMVRYPLHEPRHSGLTRAVAA